MILVVKGIAKLSKEGSNIIISQARKSEDGSIKWENFSIPILDLELLVVVGSRVRLSSAVINMVTEAGVPILIHSRATDCLVMNPFYVKIVDVRRNLYKAIENDSWRVSIGKCFILGKLRGMVNVARYFTYKEREKDPEAPDLLDKMSDYESQFEMELKNISKIDDLRLVEAKWSKKLWEILSNFIPRDYGFSGREPKSRDPVNSSVNYTYAIIYTLSTHALIASGLDPYVGIIHSERAGKTSLTYDFSEMFKPVAIHATITSLRIKKIDIDRTGYLTKESVTTVTRELNKCLKRKHKSWKYTTRGEIYAKALELRRSIEKGNKLEPFIYQIK